MTWLAEWISKYAGAFFGSSSPEPLGNMAAVLRGAGSISGSLTAGISQQKHGASSKHKKAIQREDDEILLLISAYYGIASNN